jgi:hypothetical protein
MKQSLTKSLLVTGSSSNAKINVFTKSKELGTYKKKKKKIGIYKKKSIS